MTTLTRALAACRQICRTPAAVVALPAAERRLEFSRAGVAFGPKMLAALRGYVRPQAVVSLRSESWAETIDRVAALGRRLGTIREEE